MHDHHLFAELLCLKATILAAVFEKYFKSQIKRERIEGRRKRDVIHDYMMKQCMLMDQLALSFLFFLLYSKILMTLLLGIFL